MVFYIKRISKESPQKWAVVYEIPSLILQTFAEIIRWFQGIGFLFFSVLLACVLEKGREEEREFDASFHLHDFLFILYIFVIYKLKCLKCERNIWGWSYFLLLFLAQPLHLFNVILSIVVEITMQFIVSLFISKRWLDKLECILNMLN